MVSGLTLYKCPAQIFFPHTISAKSLLYGEQENNKIRFSGLKLRWMFSFVCSFQNDAECDG